MSPGLVWLSSYPKSGNTWLRVLLTNYLKKTLEPASLESLIGETAGTCAIFDEYSGLEASDLTRELVLNLRPDVYREFAMDQKETRYLKVHEAYLKTPAGQFIYPPDVTQKTIYIVRHPGDVALSFAAHFDTNLNNAVKNMMYPNFTLTPCLFRGHLPQTVGDWGTNVTTWADAKGMKVFLVRYEDFLENTEHWFRRILEHLEIPVEQEKLEKAVANSSFSRLQKLERECGFHEKPKRSRSFFREGRVGQWREELPTDLRRALWKSLAVPMARFGYSFD